MQNWSTGALKNGKIRESIAFDFQHGYQMWTWFVNLLDKKTKINFNKMLSYRRETALQGAL